MNEYLGLIKKRIKWIDYLSPWPLFYPWIMSENEKILFDKIIKRSNYFLEFGSGGSTIRSLTKSNTKIYSVDSSLEWIQFMRKYFIVRYFEGKRLDFLHIDIGPTKEWGNPIDDSFRHLYPNFSSKIFENLNPKDLDTIFVDGRFRVACVLNTIIHLYDVGSFEDKTIMIHDFWNRDYYHVILRYVDVIAKVETLGVFKVKETLNIIEVKKHYDHYKFDIR